MANKSKFQAIKGTRDLLPPETALWNQVEQTAREIFSTFHFGEIRSPIFEPTELFARAVGGDTDIVGKEMYTFERKLSFLREDFAKAASFENNSDDLLRAIQSFGINTFNVQNALESNQIPTTDDNKRLAGSIVELYRRSFARWSEGARELDEEWRELFKSAIESIYAVDIGQSESLRP
jgi:hypothetical protein